MYLWDEQNDTALLSIPNSPVSGSPLRSRAQTACPAVVWQNPRETVYKVQTTEGINFFFFLKDAVPPPRNTQTIKKNREHLHVYVFSNDLIFPVLLE